MFLSHLKKISKIIFLFCLILTFNFCQEYQTQESQTGTQSNNPSETPNPVDTDSADEGTKIIENCNKDNYRNFIFDSEKTTSLIKRTGAGCQLQDNLLENINLENADLRDANLQNAKLQNVKFKDADLTNADFRRADLQGADFRDADLENTNFQNADLQGADLRDTDLEDAKLLSAKYNRSTTKFPTYNIALWGFFGYLEEDFDPEAEGMIPVEDNSGENNQEEDKLYNQPILEQPQALSRGRLGPFKK